MNVEESRLQTFQTWPANAAVQRQRIAKAGFFYTGQGLEVQCFSCGGKISYWNYGDQVMARHRQLNPDCPFVKNPIQSGNVPILNLSTSRSAPNSLSAHTLPSVSTSLIDMNNISQEDNTPLVRPRVSIQEGAAFSTFPSSIANSGPRGLITVSSTPDNVANSGPRGLINVSSNAENSGNVQMGTFSHSTMYRSEATRLQSFSTWPIPLIVAPEKLAKAGFYYIREADKVQCAFCSGIVGHWEIGDDPEREHRRHFPSCPLHYNIPVGNIPMGRQGDVNSPDGVQQYHDACSSVVLRELRPFSRSEGDKRVCKRLSDDSNMKELGIQSHRGPQCPKYSTFESRLRTFKGWPSHLRQTPEQLAQAGFYYMGMKDQVRCFHCDGGLRQWDASDDPWTEHARWFSKCAFVVLVKGEEFIQEAISQHPPILAARAAQNDREEAVPTEQPYRVRSVTEEELEGLMTMLPAMTALQVGLNPARVKRALRQKMEQTGLPYTNSDCLIEAVLDLSSETHTSESSIAGPSRQSERGREEVVMRVQSVPDGEAGKIQEQRISSDVLPSNMSKSLPSLSERTFAVSSMASKSDINAQSLPHLSGSKPVKTDAMSLEEENRRLKEARLCKICMDEEVGVVFLPCGHLVTCVNCAPSLQDCPVCRQSIKATVRTFLS